jgi:hypothetical protein
VETVVYHLLIRARSASIVNELLFKKFDFPRQHINSDFISTPYMTMKFLILSLANKLFFVLTVALLSYFLLSSMGLNEVKESLHFAPMVAVGAL